jgi:hypothetical protein
MNIQSVVASAHIVSSAFVVYHIIFEQTYDTITGGWSRHLFAEVPVGLLQIYQI